MTAWRDDPAGVRPMLATTADAPLESAGLAYEPKYDGIRALVATTPASLRPAVRIWSRLGNEKTSQFADIVSAVAAWARGIGRPLLLDGEIVALDAGGSPSGFQKLQGRIHLRTPTRPQSGAPVALFVFDLLRDGDEDLRSRPLHERRARLERLFATDGHGGDVRLGEQAIGSGRALFERAAAHGWEGIVAKRLDSPYRSGRRAPEWRKLKLQRRQACVIAGWTDPRGSRPFFGALLLGVYDDQGALHYVGHTGAGFTDAELGRVWKRLHALQVRSCPFAVRPRTNEKPHWVKPELVAEVKFTEWTAEGRLRHPTYLGMRDDVEPRSIRKEPDQVKGTPAARPSDTGQQVRLVTPAAGADRAVAADRPAARVKSSTVSKAMVRELLAQLDAIDEAGGSGTLTLPEGGRLEITNLGKVFWPKGTLTKGDLFRHYVRVAPLILPVVADRPLVMKRYPNGVTGKPFYQHRAPDKLPSGVRVDVVETDNEERPHLVGGSLTTLLYMTQLASISQDPWFSRADAQDTVDHVAIDLDPPEGVPFRRVLDVALWVRDELDTLKAPGFPKTSGAGGLHVYVPMPAGTPYEAGLLFCQIVATMVAKKHPKAATIERAIKARGSRIYVDYLQNIRGKTLACAYSARASEFAGVSTPLTWDEVEAGVSPKDFTIRTFEARLREAGDLWGGLRKSKGADLRAVMKYAEPSELT